MDDNTKELVQFLISENNSSEIEKHLFGYIILNYKG